MRRILALSGGSYQHHRTWSEPKYRAYLSEVVYLLDLPAVDLRRFDAVVLPDRLHRGRLAAAGDALRRFLQAGGIVVAFGEQTEPWLPGVRWEDRPTNFWWWREPGGSSGLRCAAPNHPLFRYVSLEDCTWHYHGVFWPPAGAQTLVATQDGGAVVYEDTVSTPGLLFLATLDPVYHFGSHFMPATERFLDGFLRWLSESEPLSSSRHSRSPHGPEGPAP